MSRRVNCIHQIFPQVKTPLVFAMPFSTCKPAASGPNLKHFILKSESIQLYREILRACKDVYNPTDKDYILKWARDDFDTHREETDIVSNHSFSQLTH
ncbi:hypothetical protein DSO57_1010573 [Entomophthora muscae]|uniref:Uncharacterized protein n=1 Tax=Entomophthora muscae TaxID=34485 RepID=A0ACC2THD9_9FUNG|nr:hypothetical protein DSO57_1010573 [Entomophthora muscae]